MASSYNEEISSSSESSSSSSESDSENDAYNQQDSFSQNGIKKATPAIRKDGMAVCERCGNVGVKHAFYSKTKRYCSLACSKGLPRTSGGKTSSSQTKTTKRPISQSASKKGSNLKKSKQDLAGSFEWKPYLARPAFVAAPVSCFKHVSMSDCWDNITVGMKIEVENKDCDKFSNLFPSFYWIATVTKIAGYMAQLRYEGFGTDSSKDFWVNLCTETIHSVGWCASQGKPLIPPKSIEHKYSDWKEYLVKRLTGARTLPVNFHLKVKEGLKSRFQQKMKLEVVDKNRISAVRVARVIEVVGGRLHVAYETAEEGDEGFWCHERSPLIHPVGWAQVVGHDLRATPEYARKSLQKTLLKKFDHDDSTWDMFLPVKNVSDLKFKEGMKLEAIDPLNLSTVCVATVTRVLRNNYLMIGIDGMMAANGSDWFCYHTSSPCIFPVGFCELNNIELTPPRGHKGEFNWFEYLKQTKSVAAPVALFKKDIPNHGFKEGMHVEAVDLMEPRLICVGCVSKVVGRLLRVHFDGWDDTYDQWCDCESPDLFPVGWCQYVGYRLEGPRNQSSEFGAKRKKKYQIYKGPRKKKKGRFNFHKRGLVRNKLGILAQENVINTGSFKQESDDTVSSTSDIPISYSPSVPDKCIFPSVESSGNRLPVLMKMGEIKTCLGGPALSSTHTESNPEEWGVLDVAQFLRINECGAYCQIFSQQKIDGKHFLSMSKEDLMSLTGMKVGPSLKIFDLIQQLRVQTSRFKNRL